MGVAIKGCGLHQGSAVTEQMSGCPARSAAPPDAVLACWGPQPGLLCRVVAGECRWELLLLLCWQGHG